MLRKTVTETTLSARKPWLVHWYQVADYYFDRYGISATTPNAKWVEEPPSKAVSLAGRRGEMGWIQRDQHSVSSDLSDTGTIIHHHGRGNLPLDLSPGGEVYRRLQNGASAQHDQS